MCRGIEKQLQRRECVLPMVSRRVTQAELHDPALICFAACRKTSKYNLSSADERYPTSILKQRGNHDRKSYDALLKLNERESLELEGGNHYSFPLQ